MVISAIKNQKSIFYIVHARLNIFPGSYNRAFEPQRIVLKHIASPCESHIQLTLTIIHVGTRPCR